MFTIVHNWYVQYITVNRNNYLTKIDNIVYGKKCIKFQENSISKTSTLNNGLYNNYIPTWFLQKIIYIMGISVRFDILITVISKSV